MTHLPDQTMVDGKQFHRIQYIQHALFYIYTPMPHDQLDHKEQNQKTHQTIECFLYFVKNNISFLLFLDNFILILSYYLFLYKLIHI